MHFKIRKFLILFPSIGYQENTRPKKIKLETYLGSVSTFIFSSIGTGCCKSLNLEGFPRIRGFRAASATATTKGMLRSVELLFKTWTFLSRTWSLSSMMSIYSSGWAEDSLDSSVETASFKVAICLKRNSKIFGYAILNEISG